MPAFCAAIGSFHAKCSVTDFVRVLTIVRVLPFFLTVTLMRSVTFTVSTFGVRSYSDHRYWSIQSSSSEHAPKASNELKAGWGAFCTGSGVFNNGVRKGGVAGGGVGR